MQKTVVIDVVGLTSRLIGEHTPFLSKWLEKGKQINIEPVLPAVTCTAQYTYLTGNWPSEHGIVGNGWYFRDECEVKFWRQSNHLVQAKKIWEAAKAENPEFTCANMFWWYNMYSSADFSVTPRPMYPADGRKLPDVYSHPMDLRDTLQKELGQFPLFEFWGPKTTINSSKWIADASLKVDQWHDPTLTLIYLPHLDYNIQRYGNDFSIIHKDLKEIDGVLEMLINYYEGKNAKVILLSEYGITDVNHPIDINRVLRKNGYITVKEELGLELLDAGASKAFAASDHQLSHVYVKNEEDIPKVKALLEKVDGIEMVLDEEGKKQHHINHDRAGELVAVADKNSWFTYYYWLDDNKAPDFARTVDIHRKPGYDPVEMFLDPKIKMPLLKVGGKLIKKKLGFRYLMDVIPLDATLVKGSHGRLTTEPEHQAVLMSKEKELLPHPAVKAVEVYDIIWKHIWG
ncbi:alkaline phosphatase family protein [Flexithrix dorotheae]|uniref:alkaline phosphatase family protein n=1 Tax=Flexithrix dorotheae TaxID=70993 RepID=UPI000365B758|nr:nucleotide pyrophosphatase/phosphodiesterase family protein [Flexithrix dorotheae]